MHLGTVWGLSHVTLSKRRENPLRQYNQEENELKLIYVLSKIHVVLPANFPTSLIQFIKEDLELCKFSRELIFNDIIQAVVVGNTGETGSAMVAEVCSERQQFHAALCEQIYMCN